MRKDAVADCRGRFVKIQRLRSSFYLQKIHQTFLYIIYHMLFIVLQAKEKNGIRRFKLIIVGCLRLWGFHSLMVKGRSKFFSGNSFIHLIIFTQALIKACLQHSDKIIALMWGRWERRPCRQRSRGAGGAGGGHRWKHKTLIEWFKHESNQNV